MGRAETDRRSQLAQAAFEVFSDRGYRNSSVADVAAAAGVSHGSFYNYFANKRDILDAAIDYGLEELAPQLSPPTEFSETFDDFLDAITAAPRALHSLSVNNSKLISLIVFDAGAIDEALTRRVVEIFESFARSLQRHIDHGIEAGFVRPGLDSQVLAEMLISAGLAVLLPAQGGAPLPGGLDHFIDQMRTLLHAGLGNPAVAGTA